MMNCPVCQAGNLDIYSFCGQCGAKLEKVCLRCGTGNLPQFQFCIVCGHNLILSSESIAEEISFKEKLEKIQCCLPGGLTEKVIAQRENIEGRRKLVTVMFCDIDGFVPMLTRLGRDKVRSIMDEVLSVLIHNVHDYGGTVNKITGEGIMALFGTPITVENAPQRCIRSSLAIHRDIAKLSPRIKNEKQIRPIRMRIGIHAGPIMVRTLDNDLRIEFTPVGDTVNLASTIEELAEPGTTCVTEETYKLTERLFQFDALEEKKITGVETPIKAYRVIAPGTRKTKLDLDAEQGLKPFVGRERELELSMDAEEYKAVCRDDLSLKELEKNPKKYKGMRVKYQGEILRIMEYRGVTDIIVDVTKDEQRSEDSVFVWYFGTTDALENDVVQIWGEVRGSYIYTSVAGWKITLPLVRAEFIDLIETASLKD